MTALTTPPTKPDTDPQPDDDGSFLPVPAPRRSNRLFLKRTGGKHDRATHLSSLLLIWGLFAFIIVAIVITWLTSSHIEALILGGALLAFIAYITIGEPLQRAVSPHWQRFSKTRVGRIVAKILAPVFYLCYKLKTFFLLALKIKYFATALTMVVSIAAYSFIWGWSFALGFVILLFIHEMGHVIAARREGISASMPMFVPFLGAAIMMREMPKNAVSEARVGLAGPIMGGLGCLLPILGYRLFGGQEWLALAYTGFFLNLFNLIPMLPLDGGRAMAAVSPWMWLPGIIILLGAAVLTGNAFLPLFAIIGAIEGWRRHQARRAGLDHDYHTVRVRTRFGVASIYLLLAAALAFGMWQTHVATHDFRLGRSASVAQRWSSAQPAIHRYEQAVAQVRVTAIHGQCNEQAVTLARQDYTSVNRDFTNIGVPNLTQTEIPIVLQAWMANTALNVVAHTGTCSARFGQLAPLTVQERQAGHLIPQDIAIYAEPEQLMTSEGRLVHS